MERTTVYLLVVAGLYLGPKGLAWALDKKASGLRRLAGGLTAAVGWGLFFGSIWQLLRV